MSGAWHESRDGVTPWRSSDMDETFKQAKEKAPNNFPRDIKTAMKSSIIHAETPRTYVVAATDWLEQGRSSSAPAGVISSSGSKVPYRVLPLPRVQRKAKKLLTSQQLHEGIQLARRFQRCPNTPTLDALTLRRGHGIAVRKSAINKQGW